MSAGVLFVTALIIANIAVMPFFLLLLAAALGALIARREPLQQGEPNSRMVIIIPAHNEESGIAATVRSCRQADYPPALFSVIVIADNCTDQTADIAAKAGARVIERFDAVKKSKGYAIEYLIDELKRSGEFAALDALVVIDADTTIDDSLLRRFDQRLRAGCDWIQCYYTVANPDQSWRTRLMTYAFSLYNGVLLLGLDALGASAGFKGNGMCFSTRGLGRLPWRCYGLVEDMEFSWTLRVAGERIAFEREARVYGAMLGSGGKAAAQQRQRWEFGRSDIRRKYLGRLLVSSAIGWWDKMISACELLLPPMAWVAITFVVLATLDIVAAVAIGGAGSGAAGPVLLACVALMTAALFTYAIAPFRALSLPWRYASSIAFFPFFMVWKVLVSRHGPPRQWVRTAREPTVPGPGEAREPVSSSTAGTEARTDASLERREIDRAGQSSRP